MSCFSFATRALRAAGRGRGMTEKPSNYQICIFAGTLLTALLAALKLCGYIDPSWVCVIAPMIVSVTAFPLYFLFAALCLMPKEKD